MKNIILFAIVLLVAACKPSEKHSVDNIYPIPDLPVFDSLPALAQTKMFTDPVLAPYLADFENDMVQYNAPDYEIDVFVQFKDLSNEEGHVIGRCVPYSNARVVVIDPTFWAAATTTDFDKKSVVYHELGHCKLDRGHRTLYWQGSLATYDDGLKPVWGNATRYNQDGSLNPNYRGNWPLSLMHRSLVRKAYFQPEEQWYIQELMTERGTPLQTIGDENLFQVDSHDCAAHLSHDHSMIEFK